MPSIAEQQIAAEHLKDLLNLESGLSEKDIEWLDKFYEQWKEKGFLTKVQIKIIYEIYERRMR